MFLTDEQKENLKGWNYSVEDGSITTKFFGRFWDKLVLLVPKNVAPNILSIVGFLCTLFAFHLQSSYMDMYPKIVSIISGFLILGYVNLDSIDGRHARRTGTSSPLGELIDHTCDNIGVVFLMLMFCYTLGVSSMHIQYYVVQIAQLIFLNSHIEAFKNITVKFGLLTGPVEFLMLLVATIFGRIFNNYGWLHSLGNTINNLLNVDNFGYMLIVGVYYFIFVYLLVKILKMDGHSSTKKNMVISLVAKLILTYFINIFNTYTIVSHGITMAILTGDMIVAKMAKREMHPMIPLLIILSSLDNFVAILLCGVYYTVLLRDIALYLDIPFLTMKN